MKRTFRATTKDDLESISAFLGRIFDVDRSASFLEPSLMAWKYWDYRGDWTEPRSYVLEAGSSIVAHLGIWPMTFGTGPGAIRGIEMIDWAAARESPGAGTALLRRMDEQFDFIYSIGGSEVTRKVLPLFGFIEQCQTWRAARPVRPMRQILSHQHQNFKLAPRFARNWFWSINPRNNPVSGWKANEIFPERVDDLSIPQDPTASLSSPRTSAFFQYYLRCPSIKFQLYQAENDNRPQGYFVMGVLRGQARIAGVWLRDPNPEAWRAVYSLAQSVAVRQREATEIAAAGTLGSSEEAAVQCGFRRTGTVPVYLLNRKGKLDLPKSFQFQLSDNDEAFFDTGQSTYWT